VASCSAVGQYEEEAGGQQEDAEQQGLEAEQGLGAGRGLQAGQGLQARQGLEAGQGLEEEVPEGQGQRLGAVEAPAAAAPPADLSCD
jgi:hypothetical protein